MKRLPLSFLVLLLLAVLSSVSTAEDGKSGLSPSKLKLPKGPGSLEGVGENASPNVNMGFVGYGVAVALPVGHTGMTPDLGLKYSSNGGASVVGMGWSLPLSRIERMTSRGLPVYDDTDVFAANGGDELVRLPGTRTYRSRYEGGFVRYTWEDGVGDGKNGYWIAEYPDGRTGYFGALSDGTSVNPSRIDGYDGTFAYYLVEVQDVHGHRLKYNYEKHDGHPYLASVQWVFSANSPRYEALLSYEDRDDELSDGKSGVEVRLTKRLVSIEVTVKGQHLNRYHLEYEPYAESGGLSRLQSVTTYGLDDTTPFPVEFAFSYSGSFDPACSSQGSCNKPYVHEMGSVGVDFATSQADLNDINGDGLPDVVDTTDGVHKLHLNQLAADGTHSFAPMQDSSVATGGSVLLASNHVQMVDVDGDGFSDMVDGLNNRIYKNEGSGDWSAEQSVTNNLPDFETNKNLKFFDYDSDKRPDVLYSDSTDTWVYGNGGDSSWSTSATLIESIGYGFTGNNLKMADMNGDGMQDAMVVTTDFAQYRMHLGWGRWSGPIDIFDIPAGVLPSEMEFIDINGDGLSDVVVVRGNQVGYALNENGYFFSQMQWISSANGGDIPEKTASVSVRFADMNGSGSTDVVWIDASGFVTYLELFPKRPNLLTKVENGIGKVIEVFYGSSVEHMAQDGGSDAWDYRLPNPVQTLDRIETYDTLSGVRQVQSFEYSNGYYDGIERQFRGFADVVVKTTGDEFVEDGTSVHHFEVGASDPYRKGLLLEQTTYSADKELKIATNVYDDCDVAEVPDTTDVPVRFICKTESEQLIKEGKAQSEWVPLRSESVYDGYGNVVLSSNLGVDGVSGDEEYQETAFIVPGTATDGRWILRAPYRGRTYSVPDSDEYSESLTYYDGTRYEGLPLGELTRGLVTRTTQKVEAGSDETITAARNQHDSHGNILSTLDANGHETRYAYDSDGVLLLSEEFVLDDAGHTPYSLKIEVSYDSVLEKMASSSNWLRVESGGVVSPQYDTLYSYDGFGRLTGIAKPGDSLDKPTSEVSYELGSPFSRIVTRARSKSGGALDLETALCFDGMGREIEKRTLVEDGTYQVTGHSEYNIQGSKKRVYQPYVSSDFACEKQPDSSTPYTDSYIDAQGRVLTEIVPDANIYGTASKNRIEYGPLYQTVFDYEDVDPDSKHYDTPTTTYTDGLGRTTRIERLLKAAGNPVVTAFGYDALGRPESVADNDGNTKFQSHDLLGRIVEVNDPDSGVTQYEYDDVGNKTRSTDARGISVQFLYDELNRPVGEWEEGNDTETLVTHHYDSFSKCAEDKCTNPTGYLVASQYPVGDGTRGIDLHGFDARGRETFRSRNVANTEFEFVTAYDNVDKATSITYPDGRTIAYQQDAAGRTTKIPGYVDSIKYEPRGMMSEAVFHNGVVSKTTYNNRLQIQTIDTLGPNDETIQGYEYFRDRAGNILSIDDLRAGNDMPSGQGEFVYDAFYRLTEATLDVGFIEPETLSYSYTTIGNIKSKTSSLKELSPAHVGAYTYGNGAGPHAVTSAGELEYAYDAAGQMVARDDWAFSWNHLGQLTSGSQGEKDVAIFGYDSEGQRIYKEEDGHYSYYISDDFEIRDGIAVTYLQLTGSRVVKIESATFAAQFLPDLAPVQELGNGQYRSVPDGKITAADAQIAWMHNEGTVPLEDAPDDADVDALLLAASRGLLIDPSGEQVTYIHQNHVGSASVSTSESGEVLQRAELYPFGEVRFNSTYLEEYLFTGQERDVATGLSYHSARYLDTKIGRWISPDPYFQSVAATHEDGGAEMNRYMYAMNNPMMLIDPSGEVSLGDLIDSWGESAANKVNKTGSASAYAETALAASARAVWDVFGAESVSTVASNSMNGKKSSGWDYTFAAIEVVPGGKVVKGGKAAVKAATAGGKKLAKATAKKAAKKSAKKAGAKSGTKSGGNGARKLVPEQDQTVYRVYGGDAKPDGASWTPTDPGTTPNFRDAAGLPSGGASGANNSGRYVVEGTLRDPNTVVRTRQALPLDGNKGGATEYIIPDPFESGAVTINRVSGVNPEF